MLNLLADRRCRAVVVLVALVVADVVAPELVPDLLEVLTLDVAPLA